MALRFQLGDKVGVTAVRRALAPRVSPSRRPAYLGLSPPAPITIRLRLGSALNKSSCFKELAR
ncbi:hypothetical protein U9M48_011631 [Paspalum notatum var. saurae]|uniref:Uncharacterized protein n=1 Tax=Paspalum notatum var. saurae TaxID=547442 RepID=A0AAQ3SW75_PASNO